MNEKYKAEYERLEYDISIGLYDKSLIAFAIQYGRHTMKHGQFVHPGERGQDA